MNAVLRDSGTRRGILITLMIGTLMAALDASIVNVSLPTMMRSFHTQMDQIEWVVSSYMMGFAVVMPLTQWLKDRWGFFWLYFASLAVFTVGSALCGFAPSLEWLIGARILQALGGGALTPTAMAVLSTVYPPHERGRVLGLWGLGVVMGPALGPALGGILTENFGWPSIFLVNLPIGAIGLYLAYRYLRKVESPRKKGIRFDFGGFAMLSLFLISLLFGISRLERDGLDSIQNLAYFAVAVFSFVAFLFVERRREHPLVDLKLFQRGAFDACLLVTFARAAALFGGVLLLPFLLQTLMGYTETQSGLLMFPGSALVAVLMPFAGRFADKHGARGISIAGLVLIAFSMFYFGNLDTQSGVAGVLIAMVLRGVGLGLLVTPIAVATVNAVDPNEVALASSLSSLVQQVGGAIGVACLAVLHQFVSNRALSNGASASGAEQSAVQWGFAVAGLMVIAAILPGLKVPSDSLREGSAEAALEAIEV